MTSDCFKIHARFYYKFKQIIECRQILRENILDIAICKMLIMCNLYFGEEQILDIGNRAVIIR